MLTNLKKAINDAFGVHSPSKEMGNTKKKEEWVWVEGYKGTNSNMQCRDYQFEMYKTHMMPEDVKIKDCEAGFHLCLTLKQVFSYYDVGSGNRFFKVKALVRQADLDEYDKDYIGGNSICSMSIRWYGSGFTTEKAKRDKLAAKDIIFLEELSIDEILAAKSPECVKWSDEYKQLAIDHGTGYVYNLIKEEEDKKRHKKEIKKLVDLGYSRPFATYIVDKNKFDIAFAVGSQTDLSMDMKVLAILHDDLDMED